MAFSTLRRMRVVVVALVLLVMAGCAQVPRASVVGEQEQINISEPPPPLANGSIYQSHRGSRPLFEDRRPRMVGDILTIVMDEQVSASKNSQSNMNQSSSAGLNLSALPDVLERLAEQGVDLSGSLSGNSDFAGGGESQASNSMTGTITVSVLEVMHNGNLRVRGEKQIGINQGVEFIRFSGVISPRTISGQNTVPSTAVADARIEYVGNGYISEAQHMGWLQRFFLNVSPF